MSDFEYSDWVLCEVGFGLCEFFLCVIVLCIEYWIEVFEFNIIEVLINSVFFGLGLGCLF